MTETYTQTIFPRKATRETDSERIQLDADDQLFYDLLKSELDALLRQPQSGIVSKITSYSQAQRTRLM